MSPIGTPIALKDDVFQKWDRLISSAMTGESRRIAHPEAISLRDVGTQRLVQLGKLDKRERTKPICRIR